MQREPSSRVALQLPARRFGGSSSSRTGGGGGGGGAQGRGRHTGAGCVGGAAGAACTTADHAPAAAHVVLLERALAGPRLGRRGALLLMTVLDIRQAAGGRVDELALAVSTGPAGGGVCSLAPRRRACT